MINLKSIRKVALSMVIVISMCTSFAFADANTVTVNVNGSELDVFDHTQGILTPGIIVEGRTLLPLRKMFEIFGVEPNWNGDDRSIDAAYNGKHLWIQIDNKNAKVDGTETGLDVPAQIINSRTYVPLRFITETFGVTPNWDGETRTVSILLDKTYLKEINLSMVLPKALEFNLPFSLSNNSYQIISKNDRDINLYIELTELSLSDNLNFFTQIFDINSESFRLINGNKEIYYATATDSFDMLERNLFVVYVNNKYYRIITAGMSYDDAIGIISSIQ